MHGSTRTVNFSQHLSTQAIIAAMQGYAILKPSLAMMLPPRISNTK